MEKRIDLEKRGKNPAEVSKKTAISPVLLGVFTL